MICVGAAAGAILAAALFSINWDTGRVRFHQHLSCARQTEPQAVSIQPDEFVSHLPVIEVDTGGQKIPGNWIMDENGIRVGTELSDKGEEMIPVEICIVDSENGNNRPGDAAALESSAMFRIRGNSSRNFAKKSYLIKLTDEAGGENSQEMMGMGEHDTWALYGPFLDKTLLRNYMWMNISGEIMGYAPNVRYCEMFLDGSYQGLYLMMETVSRGTYRVDLEAYKPGAAYTDYIVRMDKANEDSRDLEVFSDYTMRLEESAHSQIKLSIVYPNDAVLNEKICDYIEKDFSRFEKALYSSDYKSLSRGYRQYIDVDSFVDYYVLQEFLGNTDMCYHSTYLYKDRLGKLHMGPVWDYNNVLDNFFSVDLDSSEFLFTDRLWYDRLLSDAAFNRQVRERYRQLRRTVLNEEYLMKYIDETVEFLGDSIERNYVVWGYSFEAENLSPLERLAPLSRNPADYEEAVGNMKAFIRERGRWLDRNIDALEQYCHPSNAKKYDNR